MPVAFAYFFAHHTQKQSIRNMSSSAKTYTQACAAAAMRLHAPLCRFQSALWQATLQ
jgi:hypothetical protein